MTRQAKELKALLKAHGLTDSSGKLSVTTERTRAGEWGYAKAHVRDLTEAEIAKLKAADPYLKISNHPSRPDWPCGFAIIRG